MQIEYNISNNIQNIKKSVHNLSIIWLLHKFNISLLHKAVSLIS